MNKVDLRPPTPGMKGAELHQWFQRLYEYVIGLKALLDDSNGGLGSINTPTIDELERDLSRHIAANIVHGTESPVIGAGDTVEITNKTIDALKNVVINLKHGVNLDSEPVAHGRFSPLVGESDEQILTNKTILGRIKLLDTPFSTISGNFDIFQIIIPNGYFVISVDLCVTGREITIDNQSTGYSVICSDGLFRIEGESEQELPPDSSAVLYFTGYEWRIK